MSLSHSGFTYFSTQNASGTIQIVSPHDLTIVIGQFFGVVGESHIISEPGGADLACEYRFQDYASLSTLRTAERSMVGWYGKATGTLTKTGADASVQSFRDCTFQKFQPFESPWKDAGGRGWIMRGILLWRQRRF